ncbi:MAG: 1-acyl-sn-glycerol-3-phosphate acyltransferase [Phycisphaerales bacterium]|nr:1-acyl-sn-glycerol-3-phosphate acyltransferase [Phycisphaerales bacterium]
MRALLQTIRRRSPGRSILAIGFYEACWLIARTAYALAFRCRVSGQHLVPDDGPLLVVANHQSNLDPPAVSFALRRRHLVFLAKASLFANPIFGRLIRGLNSVPIQAGSELGPIRTALDELAKGGAVLIFPEGSRTLDGAMHPFKRGAWLVLSKAKCRVLPVAIEGAYDAFRRGVSLPTIGRPVRVRVGEPIDAADLLAMGADAGLEHLRQRIEALRMQMHADLTSRGCILTSKPMTSEEQFEPDEPARPDRSAKAARTARTTAMSPTGAQAIDTKEGPSS